MSSPSASGAGIDPKVQAEMFVNADRPVSL